MSLDIDFNGIKSGIGSACKTTSTTIGKLSGRLTKWIQSGTQAAKPYLQDKEIAAVALIGVTIVLTDISLFFEHLCNKYGPTALKDSPAIPIVIVAGGVAAFVSYTQMTLTPLAVITISVATVVLRYKLKDSV